MSKVVTLIVAVVLGVAGMVAIKALMSGGAGGVAPTPAVFDRSPGLDAALERSGSKGIPVFVVATADWCAPCQMLKRRALASDRVQTFLAENTIPVYLNDAEHREDIARLGVSAYPTSLIIQNGEITDRLAGAVAAGDYLAFLEASIDPSGPATASVAADD